MRLLHCIHSLHGGGAETQLGLLATEMATTGNRVAVFYVDGEPTENDGIQYFQCPADRYPWGLMGEMRQAMVTFRPDIVHLWLPETIVISGIWAALRTRTPVVASYRNRMSFERLLSVIAFLLKLIFAKTIISNSQVQQSIWPFRWLFKLKHGAVIPNAISNQLIAESAKIHASSARQSDRLNLVCVGRLTAQKNLRVLISSLPKLDSSLEYTLNIFGQGELKDELTRQAKELGLEGKVTFHGYTDNPHRHIAEADVLVLPSLYEGTPNVLFEALALGTPAIISDVAAHTSLFTSQEVQFFRSNDADSLATEIEKFVANRDEYESRVPKGQDRIRNFTPEFVAGKYLGVYKKLLSNMPIDSNH